MTTLGIDGVTSAQSSREALESAVAAVPRPTLSSSLQDVAEAIPPALGVDFVNIRVRATDSQLHLLAASGCNPTEIRRRAFHPLSLEATRDLVASGGHELVAHSLGIEWVEVAWLLPNGDSVGTMLVGARTRRRPTQEQLALLHRVSDMLAERIEPVDRTPELVVAAAKELARYWAPRGEPSEGPLVKLRPRERQILELYADGLSTSDIAEVLVISPHTVRTHVKLALRRLGLRSRADAAVLVRSDQLAQLI